MASDGFRCLIKVTSTSVGFCSSLNFSQLFKKNRFLFVFLFYILVFSMASDGFWSIKVTSTSVGFWPALLSANWSSCTGKTKRDKCQVESHHKDRIQIVLQILRTSYCQLFIILWIFLIHMGGMIPHTCWDCSAFVPVKVSKGFFVCFHLKKENRRCSIFIKPSSSQGDPNSVFQASN